ncbi:hypothetical protein Gpo141_00006141 [Globisporangium polare]
MGISENRTNNGQDSTRRLHQQQQQQHRHLHPHASPSLHPDSAGQPHTSGQVYPSDWHTQQHLSPHTKFPSASSGSSGSMAASAASEGAHYMDVDQYDGPECVDDRSSPVSPSAMALAYHDRSSFTFGSSASFSSHHQQQQQQRQLPSLLSHFSTPVTRFKAAHGYARKSDEPLATSSATESPDASPRNSFSSTTDGGNIRLPSLAYPGTPPLSPHNSRWSASSPRDAFPSPRRGFPLTASESMRQVFPTNNRAGFSSPSSPQITLAPLRRSAADDTTMLPSLASLASSLPTDRASSLSSVLSAEEVGGPFQYQRAQSCPSDEYHISQHQQQFTHHHQVSEPAAAPLYILKSNVPKNNLVRSCSVDADTAFSLRSRTLLAPPQVPEPEAIQRWLEPAERQPMRALVESAHAMQMLERSRSPSLSSGPNSPMSGPNSPMSVTRGNISVSGGAASEDESFSFAADSKREKKLCSFPQCASNAVTRGKCISHGGGRRCQKKGCTRGAQSKGLCVAHGGGRICRERGCSNIQRSMGLCIRHGGGKRCSMPGCQKGVVRQDLCTAHGGKRKCRVDDCTKHVKKRGLCRSHANSLYASSG